MNKPCSRCGGTGLVSKGQVINGVCYGCGGSGVKPVFERSKGGHKRCHQYVIVDAQGHHLALNTDKAILEGLLPTIPNAVAIQELC